MSGNRIYELANDLVEKYKIRDPFEIAERLGINVVFYDLGSLNGLYNLCLGNRFIAVNKKLSDPMQCVVVAHELGHDRLHRELAKKGAINEFSLYDMTSKPEREANIFAANIILGDDEVFDIAKDGYTTLGMARILRVPHELLKIKLLDMRGRGFELSEITDLGKIFE